MKDVKIIKLPTIGSAYSIKTRKQGRKDSIDYIVDKDNKNFNFEHSKKKVNKEVTDVCIADLKVLLESYSGDNAFILSIKRQAKLKGCERLTFKQRMVAFRVMAGENNKEILT